MCEHVRGWHQATPMFSMRWMPSRLSPLVVAAVSAAAAAAADDDDDNGGGGGGGGGDADDDDDYDNDDNYDDDDDAFLGLRTCSTRHPRVLCTTVHSVFLILSRAPVNRGLPSIVEKKQQKKKDLTGDCSALYWTQELGLTCLESGRRAASNEPSCFSRR